MRATTGTVILCVSSNPCPVRAWRAEYRGYTEGDETKSRALVRRGDARLSRWANGHGQDWAEGASSMEFQDKMLKCVDCGADFVFTSGEQMFFHDKQFRNEPKRCKSCKAKRVSNFGASGGGQRSSSRTE